MITRIVLAAAVAAFGVTAVVAQSDPIAARKALMKANGDQARIAREMMDGKTPYNNEAAKKVFATFENAAAKMPALFPDNSKTGDTAALPAVLHAGTDGIVRLLVGGFGFVIGQIFTIFVITDAVAEAAVGLGILIALFRNKETVQADQIDLLKW